MTANSLDVHLVYGSTFYDERLVVMENENTLETTLFAMNIPIELRVLIESYYGEIGFAEKRVIDALFESHHVKMYFETALKSKMFRGKWYSNPIEIIESYDFCVKIIQPYFKK